MARYRKRKIGKCPKCCPDGGAVLHKTWKDDGSPAWKCMNCDHVVTRRVATTSGKPTLSQETAVARLAKAFGVAGPRHTKMMGRVLWVEFENNDRPWHAGQLLYGPIGATGKLHLSLSTYGKDTSIQNDIDIKVYLERR